MDSEPTRPSWLRDSSDLPDGVRLLSDEECRNATDSLRTRYKYMPMGTLWPGDSYAHAQQMSARAVPIMAGPAFPPSKTQDSQALEAVWYLDPDSEALYAAFSSEVAPFLWLQCEPRIAAVVDLVERMSPTDAPRTSCFRALMGSPQELRVPDVYSGNFVPADPAPLTNYWLFNPYRPNDPLASAGTVFSNSLVRCEHHIPLDLYVWHMEYAPAKFETKLAELNAIFHADLPLDLPLDAVGCALGFRIDSERMVRKNLDATPVVDAAQIAYWLVRVAAIGYESETLETLLRSYSDYPHESVRYAVAMSGINAGLRDLVVGMRAHEAHSELLEAMADPIPDMPQVVRHARG